MQRTLSTLALFTSFSTLLCCALPALMVTIGAGAALAGLVSNVPQLVWLSENKEYLFIISGIMLGITGLVLWKNRHSPCPADSSFAKACMRARNFSKYIFVFSVAIYLTGAFFAYVAPYLI